MPSYHLVITEECANQRLDKALTTLLAAQGIACSRARIQSAIEENGVQPYKAAADKVKAGEQYQLTLNDPVALEAVAQDIPLEVVFEDDDVIVLNKAAGLVVHPAAGNWEGTVVNALLHHCAGQLSGIGGVQRPGIVHRLDKETSGLMVVAKNDFSHQHLSQQFSDRTLSRTYLALVWGVPKARHGRIDQPIGRDPVHRQKMAIAKREGQGKVAITDYQVQHVYGEGVASLISCKLLTGRTHQIRVHLAWLGHPLIGDPVYGGQKKNKFQEFRRQALHAAELQFVHPRTQQLVHFNAPLPKDFLWLMEQL